jgi:outer membrane lipoprotein LolB
MIRAAALIVTTAVLAACAALPPARVAQRVHEGRFALTATWPDRLENVSGRFSLSIHSDGLTLDLASPLGNTIARIDTDANGARMIAPGSDGAVQRLQGANADALAEKVLGWSLPVSGIGDWIVGRPVAARAHRSTEGEEPRIEQDGWTIRVLERFDGDAGAPRRLAFERAPSAGSPAVTLRLVLDDPAAS